MPYLIKLSISLSLIYLFYLLFLRRLTFHTWNRWYLLLYPAAAFLLPLIDISSWLPPETAQQSLLVRYVPVLDGLEETDLPVQQTAAGIDYTMVIKAILIAGSVLMLIKFGLQYWSLQKIRATAHLVLDDGIRVYQVNKPIVPFSFGRSVYINQALHDKQDLKEIIRHEFIHIKQRHTIDMIWSEALCILNWYNPFAWLLCRAIRQNLEFIADEAVLLSGLDRKQYQYILLKVTGMPGFSIANNFNFSSLKKRIAMMNKSKSARLTLSRFLLIMPVLAILLLAFRNVVADRITGISEKVVVDPPAVTTGNEAAISATDTLPKKTGVSLVPAPNKAPGDVFSGYRDIRSLKETAAGVLLVTRKDGKVEQYNMRDKKEVAAFEWKYLPRHGATSPAEMMVDSAIAVSETFAPAAVSVDEAVATAPGVLVGVRSPNKAPTHATTVSDLQYVQLEEIREEADTITLAYIRNGKNVAVESYNRAMAGSANPVIEKQELIAQITSGLTREDLKQVAADLAKKGVQLKIETLRFDQEQIVFLKGVISYQGEHNYFRVTDFNILKIYKNTTNGKDWVYFKLNKGNLSVSDHQ